MHGEVGDRMSADQRRSIHLYGGAPGSFSRDLAAAGDQVLREVAESISGDLRSYDIVTRVGGDEFVCALSGETAASACRRYERISDHLAAHGNGAAITVGLASHRSGDTLETLVERADTAMLAKRR
jgi:diguanylate cyclase (GGDEF)-like protein